MSPADVTCSVVIPTYNAAHLIGQQLQALLDQVDSPPFEVVIADNCSTDDLDHVVGQWQDRLPHLRIVDASRGQGVSVARNVGFEQARTDRILICDADDIVAPTWVAAMDAALDESAIVGGALETTRLSGPSSGWVPIESKTTSLLTTWGNRPYAFGGNTAMRREVFDAVGGYDEDYPAGAEEIDFAWRAIDHGFTPTYVPEALIHYRIRTDLRGVLRQQYNSGRGTATLYNKFRPEEVVPKSILRRIHHELLLLQQFPWRGSSDDRRRWATLMAFEAGKLVEARRLGCPAP